MPAFTYKLIFNKHMWSNKRPTWDYSVGYKTEDSTTVFASKENSILKDYKLKITIYIYIIHTIKHVKVFI